MDLADSYVMLCHTRFLLWERYSEFLSQPEQYGWLNRLMVYSSGVNTPRLGLREENGNLERELNYT